MIPVLFKEDEQIFTHNGIGALYESLSCSVIEEENGSFTMELEYPVDGELFSEIKDFRIIQAKPNDIDEPHNFRIYEIEKNIGDLTVYVRANTRTNDLGNNLITNYVGDNVTPQQAMDGIKNNLIEPTEFDFISDIQTLSNVGWARINPLNAIVGTRGSMVDIWGGEIKRTNREIYLYSRRGRDNVITIRPGKNIEGLNMTVSTAGLITKILPTFSYSPVDVPEYRMVEMHDGTMEKQRVSTAGSTILRDDILVLGDVVSSQYVDNYPTNYWSSVDYGDDNELRETIDNYIDTRLTAAEESPTILDMSGFEDDLQDFVKTELDKKANQYFIYRNPKADKPTVRITVDMFQLSDSPDWEEFKDLERIGLTDTLDVWVEEYDIDVEVRVTSLTYDSIGEQVSSFTAGSDRAPRQSAMEKKYDDLTESTNDYITRFKNGVQNLMSRTADQLNRRFEGYTEPPAELSSEGDMWFKEIGEGKVELWIHDGVYWQPLMTEDFGKKLEADIEAAQEEAERAQATADETIDNINQVVNDNGFTTLEELFASKITGEDAETMFYQEAEAIGLVYMEDGIQKAIIGIQDGIPYIKGENVILDGNTIVDGDFKVTGDMMADGAVIHQLEAEGINAQNVNIINLDASSIMGGNLELSQGLKITHNGKVIFGVNAYNQIAMDEDIREELKGDTGEQGTEGPEGPEGPKGDPGIQGPPGANGQSQWTYIRYSDNSNGSNMDDYPTSTTKYIGIVVTDSESVPPHGEFTWSKYIGEDGSQGPQGIKGDTGADGKPTYTWVKYADTPTSGMDDFPDGKKYIGLAFNQTTATESTSYGAYQWSLMPQNIEIGGRNYFVDHLMLDVDNYEKIGSYYYYTINNLSPEEVYTVSVRENFTNDITIGTGANRALRINNDKTDSLGVDIIDVRLSNGIRTYEREIRANESGQLFLVSYVPSLLTEIKEMIKIERGNIATDWTEAPEDTQAKLDAQAEETQKIKDDLNQYVEVEGYDEQIGEITTALNNYLSALKETNNAVHGLRDENGELIVDIVDDEEVPRQGGAMHELNTLLDRTRIIEAELGNLTQTWNFNVSQIVMGDEGMFVGDENGTMGIRISPGKPETETQVAEAPRIDFVDGNTIVAYISGTMMRINRAVFVESITIGEHEISTISGGHTIWQWVNL